MTNNYLFIYLFTNYYKIFKKNFLVPAELHILRKELFNNWYRLSTYFIAFLVTNMPIQVNIKFLYSLVLNFFLIIIPNRQCFPQMIFCFIYTSVSYYLSAQLMTWTRFLMFLFVCQLMTLISEGIGLILGTAMNPVVSQC